MDKNIIQVTNVEIMRNTERRYDIFLTEDEDIL